MVLPPAQQATVSHEHNTFMAEPSEITTEWTVMRKDGMFLRIRAEALVVTLQNEKKHKMTIIEVID